MPFARCRHYADDGSGHCPRLGHCDFVHPSEPLWAVARPSRQGPPQGPRNSKPERRPCRFFAQDGTPIQGGCRKTRCLFLHPTDPEWSSASTKPLSASTSTWGNAETSRYDDSMSRPMNRGRHQAATNEPVPWGSFGGGAVDNAESTGFGDSALAGGWGSSTGGGGGWASAKGDENPSIPESTAKGGWQSCGATNNEDSNPSTSGGWGSLTTTDNGWDKNVETRGSVPTTKTYGWKSDAVQSGGEFSAVTGNWESSGARQIGGWGSSEHDASKNYTEHSKATNWVPVGTSNGGSWGSSATRDNSNTFTTRERDQGWQNAGRRCSEPSTSGWGSTKPAAAEANSAWEASVSAVTPSTELEQKPSKRSRRGSMTTGGFGSSGGGWDSARGGGWESGLASSADNSTPISEAKLTTASPMAIDHDEPSTWRQNDPEKSPATAHRTNESTSPRCLSGSTTAVREARSESLPSLLQSPSLSCINDSRHSTSASDFKKWCTEVPKTQQEKREFIKVVVSMLSEAVQADSQLRDAELQRQRWKKIMASDRYARASRAGKKKLDEVREDWDTKALDHKKRLSSLVTNLAELPIFLSDGSLDLGINPELKGVKLQLKEVKERAESMRAVVDAHQLVEQSLRVDDAQPADEQRKAMDEISYEERKSLAKQQLTHLEEKADDLERVETPDVRIWDVVWTKLQQKLDEFVVERQLEDDTAVIEDLKRQGLALEDSIRAVNEDMGNIANDLALVIDRQTQVEYAIGERTAQFTRKKRTYNEMMSQQRWREEFADAKLEIKSLTGEVQRLSANTSRSPVCLEEVETMFQGRIDECSQSLKKEVKTALESSSQKMSVLLEEQQNKMAEAVWRKLQRPLMLTEVICDYFGNSSVGHPGLQR